MTMQSYLRFINKKVNKAMFIATLITAIIAGVTLAIDNGMIIEFNKGKLWPMSLSTFGFIIFIWLFVVRPGCKQFLNYDNLNKNTAFKSLSNNDEIMKKLIAKDDIKNISQYGAFSITLKIINLKLSNLSKFKINHLPMIFKNYYLIDEPSLNDINFDIVNQKAYKVSVIFGIIFLTAGIPAGAYLLLNK